MSWKLVQAINVYVAEKPAEAAALLEASATALDAVREAEIEIDSVEHRFLEGIPSTVWSAMKAAIGEATARNARVAIGLSPGFNYALLVSTPHADSDEVSVALLAPDPYATQSSKRGTTAKRKAPAAKKASAERKAPRPAPRKASPTKRKRSR